MPVRRDGPFPAEFGAISGVGAGALAAVRGLVQRPVEGDLFEVQADDAIERSEGFVAQLVEHTGIDPFVSASPQRCV